MAHHSITVRNVTSSGDGGVGKGIVSKSGKQTSVKTQFEKKSNGKNILKFLRVARNLNVGAAAGSLGGGAGIAVAAAQEFGSAMRQGVNIYSNFMEAKTGESMKYHNMRQSVNALTQPFQFAKKAIYDYGIVAPMRINRQNEILNYDRRLTGNLIHSEIYQRGN